MTALSMVEPAAEFERRTLSLHKMQQGLEANIRSRRRLLQAFDALAASAEADLRRGEIPLSLLSRLEQIEAELRQLDEALHAAIVAATEKILASREPL